MIIINDKNFFIKENTIVTLGNFDGFHSGHLELIKRLNEEKNKFDDDDNGIYFRQILNNNSSIVFEDNQKLLSSSFKTVIFSFYPHPLTYIKNVDMKTILSLEEKTMELEKLGLDYFINYPFDDDTMNIEAEEFVKEILVKRMNLKKIIIGEGGRFGKGHKGDVKLLKKLGIEYDFQVIVVPQKKQESEKISSTQIRELLINNKFEEIKKLLEKDYYISGTVIAGKKLGRKLQFPTANILPSKEKLLPQNGVYITKTEVDGQIFESISNIGYNPTVDTIDNKTIETHILNYSNDLYGKIIKITFFEFIREEKKFINVEKLKEQILVDYDIAVRFFKSKK